ncbi:hypothetical protein AAW51_1639 [Caldimonas brevitalea]|uniref:Uncharacterized protein n=1 Tax=Caldimonas brevitalea TaxID=413882 RepID=A0A0G3BP65_9BURK|nr:hypothetical protein AAW51_1639 [Caldimonas brevitalea]
MPVEGDWHAIDRKVRVALDDHADGMAFLRADAFVAESSDWNTFDGVMGRPNSDNQAAMTGAIP